jgi:tetratricopeptide (TPR) repeat protein
MKYGMSLKGVTVMKDMENMKNMKKWILTVSALLMMTGGAYGRDLWDLKKEEMLVARVELPAWNQVECVKTLAFIPFEQAISDSDGQYKPRTDWGIAVTEGVAQGLLDESEPYGIMLQAIDPEAVDKTMSEKKLTQAGLANERMALELGRAVGGQAVVYGRVGVDIKTLGEKGRAYWICPAKSGAGVEIKPVRCLVRTVTVSLTMKIVSASTGKSLFVFNQGLAETADFQPKLYATQDIQPEGEVVQRLFKQLVKDVVAQLTPRDAYRLVKTEKVKSEPAKAAREYLLRGDIGQAITLFREGLQIKPDDHGAWYNLGLAYEMVGSLAEARKAYERAYWIEDEDEYRNAIRQLDARLETMKPAPCPPPVQAPAPSGPPATQSGR